MHGNLGVVFRAAQNARVCLAMPDKLLEARRSLAPTGAVNNPYRRDQIERVSMKGSSSQQRVRLPAGMEQRLLEELKRNGADGLADTSAHGCSQVSQFTAVYRAAIERLLGDGVGGVILPPPLSDSNIALEALRGAKIPFVAVW